ncbi:RNA-binding S4 domain-containing protein [Deinococcus misasensis]|uniref:RNA-binding S4 domain-containing protein n=1 Tax=Deinococcus misasensis TaxID=392413 RepID=UPI001FDEE24D|nr:RNA-binding S4 domain-containing protein [Deinococcus misasensis]
MEGTIDLQDWLKLQDWVQTGGHAKFVIQGGEVKVNGEIETRRRKKLREGDTVTYQGRSATVHL